MRCRPPSLSDHFDGKRFRNPWGDADRSFADLLRWKFTSRSVPWPAKVHNTRRDLPPERVHGEAVRITCIGHSTVLIQTAGVNILTDPVFSERTGPVMIGPRRVREPGLSLAALPPIDVVLVTHNHYDHLDLPSLAALWRGHRPRLIAPLGDARLVERAAKGATCEELDWWECVDVAHSSGGCGPIRPERASAACARGRDVPGPRSATGSIRIHAAPAHHWSARGLFDRREALWCSFVLETPAGLISFFGDTGYGSGEPFRRIRERFGPSRVALLPIGAYEPRWFMAQAHMNPEEAVRAFRSLDADHALALHHGVFKLTDEGIGQPLADLAEALEKHCVPPEAFRAPDVGEAWTLP
ncbi:MBL fold metallo-hydrolase [Fundidesulfovibrio terrae]|uniref:MBL fold metallo-hydrolase n=1 Tax=Fundidesulfovibrio terrae TaxID=2922866 RepID=UPI001FAEFA25|nr:MBL fold metallo-hydrolase [Fundidesulfovibrio terrae]